MGPSTLLIFALSWTLTRQESTTLKLIEGVYNRCVAQTEVLKCFKIQGLKVIDRALRSKAINLVDGVTLVSDRQARKVTAKLNDTELEKLASQDIDGLIVNTTSQFLDGHKLQIRFPRLVEEARRRRRKGGAMGALFWALAIKGSFLAMAYQGIAVMAGTAIIVGKMALLLSAILGLKKLVSGGQEKTTVEIVKYPKHSESHSHSSSHEDDGHYRRAWDVEDSFGRKIGRRPSLEA